ncbi:MAG: ABC transporter ATP-binding protein [Bryobacterales bacterium]
MLSTLRTLLPYLLHHRWRYAGGAASLAVRTLFAAAIPFALKFAVDALAARATTPLLMRYAAVLFGLAAAKGVFQYLTRRILIGASRDIEFELRNDLAGRLLDMPLRFYSTFSTGDLMSRSVNDLNAVRMMLGPGLMFLLETALTFAAALTVMSATDWQLTALVFLTAPLVTLTVSHYGRRTHDRFQKVQERVAELTSAIEEHLTAVRMVRVYARGDSELRRFGARNDRLLKENLALIDIWQRMYPRIELLVGSTYAVVLGFGGWRVIQGVMTLGDFVMFMTYMAMLTWPMISLGWVINLVERGGASLGRINEVLHHPVAIADGPLTNAGIDSLRGDLELRDVTVHYPSAAAPALENVSVEIPAGSAVAIVGTVGSGKSTFLRLIARLVDPSSGVVLVDGVDLRSAPLAVLRGSIGSVPQDSVLFHQTVRDNLLLGNPAATDWEIEEACSVAQVWEDIQALPQGLDTLVGERGVTLSGGQRQRLALARALLRDPRILILDDALSHVDAATEAQILDRLRTYMRNRTALIVSHRPAAAEAADFVLTLDHGRIVERGAHRELLALGGRYATIYRRRSLEEELLHDEG